MKPDNYNRVRLALDQALRVFHETESELSGDERKFLGQLELLRSFALKAESGHPFPFEPSAEAPRLAESRVADPGSGIAISCDDPPKKSKRITVVVADDQDSVRELLLAVLAAEGDFEVVAEARNGREAVAQVAAHRPDLVIMDLNMPVLDGIGATRESLRASPTSKVLVFSANRDSISVDAARKAGALGYLFKPAPRRVLVGALRNVYRGETVLPDGISTASFLG